MPDSVAASDAHTFADADAGSNPDANADAFADANAWRNNDRSVALPGIHLVWADADGHGSRAVLDRLNHAVGLPNALASRVDRAGER